MVTKYLSATVLLSVVIVHLWGIHTGIVKNPKYDALIVEETTPLAASDAYPIHLQDILYYFPKETTHHPRQIPMICLDFKILQANRRKSKDVSQSLFNDDILQSYSAILITKPWAKLNGQIPYTTRLTHMCWQPFFRSCTYTT